MKLQNKLTIINYNRSSRERERERESKVQSHIWILRYETISKGYFST